MNRLPILMTASVSTKGMKGACFSDAEREKMYAQALSFYIDNLLKNPDQKIVFAENSDWDLEHLKALLPPFDPDRIEFISVPSTLFDNAKGKGYNEILLINHAVRHSALINYNRGGGFLKVTGRYPIYNLDYLVKKASEAINEDGMELFADVKDHKLYDWLGLGWNGHSFDCRIFGVKTSFYMKNFAEAYMKCNDYDGNLLEKVLFDIVKATDVKMQLRFPREPHFGGLEGSNISALSFTKEQDSFKGKIKRGIGNTIRILTPWFWF